jgi:hypothetical protein
MRSAVRIAKDSLVAEIPVFQKPQEFRVAKDLNLNARKSKFPVFQNQLFAERWTSILGADLRPQSTAGSAYNWQTRG